MTTLKKSLSIDELKVIFEGTSEIARKDHQEDIEYYIQRGKDVEKQTLVSYINKKLERPKSLKDSGIKSEIVLKIYGKAHKLSPESDKSIPIHYGYTYNLTGVDFGENSSDFNRNLIFVDIPRDAFKLIKNYSDLDRFSEIYLNYLNTPPEEEPKIKTIQLETFNGPKGERYGRGRGYFPFENYNYETMDELMYLLKSRKIQIGSDVKIGNKIRIGSNVTIGDNVTIGNNTSIYCRVTINNNSVIGNDCQIYTEKRLGENLKIGDRVSILENTTIGDNCTICDNCSIGSDHAYVDNVTIGNNVYIDKNVCLNPSGNIVIEDNCLLGKNLYFNLKSIHIGSDTVLKDNVTLDPNNLGTSDVFIHGKCIMKSSEESNIFIGKKCIIGHHCIIHPHVRIMDNVNLGSYVQLFDNVQIGNNTKIGYVSKVCENSIINDGCTINDNVLIGTNVIINCNVEIGDSVKIYSGCQIVENSIIQKNETVYPDDYDEDNDYY